MRKMKRDGNLLSRMRMKIFFVRAEKIKKNMNKEYRK